MSAQLAAALTIFRRIYLGPGALCDEARFRTSASLRETSVRKRAPLIRALHQSS
jgi:hypothetical protein